MIGADTNLIIRFLVRDNDEQAFKVKSLLEEGTQLYLNEVVVAELYWVLRHVYNYTPNEIVLAFDNLLETRNVSFFNSEVVRLALSDYIHSSVGFADCLIHRINAAVTTRTYTFDKRASSLTFMELL